MNKFVAAMFIGLLFATDVSAGAINGKQRAANYLRSGEKHSYIISFEGGRPAVVTFWSPDNMIQCSAYDANGNLLAFDMLGKYCSLNFRPRRDSKITLVVGNLSDDRIRYAMVTN
jgi:hypothetical protein